MPIRIEFNSDQTQHETASTVCFLRLNSIEIQQFLPIFSCLLKPLGANFQAFVRVSPVDVEPYCVKRNMSHFQMF